jgi:hypothetical protein
MVIQGGSFKGRTGDLKPKEVVSLLLDDEELEQRVRERAAIEAEKEQRRLAVEASTKIEELTPLTTSGGGLKRKLSRSSSSSDPSGGKRKLPRNNHEHESEHHQPAVTVDAEEKGSHVMVTSTPVKSGTKLGRQRSGRKNAWPPNNRKRPAGSAELAKAASAESVDGQAET